MSPTHLHPHRTKPASARLRSYFSGLMAACLTLGAVGVPFSSQPALAANASPAENCTTYFQSGGGDGSWSTPANWSTGQLPNDQDIACVIDETATVDAVVAVKQLHGNGTVVLNSGALALEQTSNIVNLEVRDGILGVGERVSPYSFIQQGGVVTGAGILDVAGAFSWSGGTHSDPEGLTFVDSDATTTLVPMVDLAWSGRQLHIDGVASFVGPGNVDFGDSVALLRHADFSGGDVIVTGDHVTITDGTVGTRAVLPAGTDIGGTWTVEPDASLALIGSSIMGTINLDQDADLRFLAGAPGAEGATIEESGSVRGIGGVTIDPDAELTVAGTLFVKYLESNGTTALNASAVADYVTNDGSLDIGAGAVLTVIGMSINAGGVTVADTATLQTGSVPIRLLGGVMALDGVIMGSLIHSDGDLVVGAAGGAAIRGTYNQSGGTLDVTVGANNNVPLVVEDDATIAGAINVDAANPLHSTESLLIAGSVSGTFAAFTHSDTICPELAYELDRVILDSVYCPTVPQIEASEDDGLTSFTVSIHAAIDEPYAFDYHTVDGSAIDGEDYVATSGTAVIPAGETSVGVEVEILDDRLVENDEDFGLIVTGPNDTAVAIASATIVDDDDRVGYDNHFRIDDIGSLGSGLYPSGINSKGIVGYGSGNADESFSWGWSFAERQRYFIGGFENEPVYDVTESGRILAGTSIREVGGARTPLALPAGVTSFSAAAINDAGQVAGVGYPNRDTAVLVRWNSDGSPSVLDAPTAALYQVEEINESGAIVGSVFFEGATAYEAFRYDGTGFHVLERPAVGGSAAANGINDAGITVGTSNQHAVMWDAEGNVTDLGPGAASDINNDDVIVGITVDLSQEFPRSVAAIYSQGSVFELADYVPDDTGYWFGEGVEINDDGVIAATGTYNGYDRTLALTPFDCYVCVTTRFDEPDVDAPANYIPVDGATTDGNPVRFEVEVTNAANSSVPVEVWVVDTLTDEALHDEAYEFSLAGGGGRQSMTFDLDTTGMAWSNGTPADPRRYEIIVTEADQNIDIVTEVASLTVEPRPMVLVHGLWSDSTTWSNYQAFAQNAHPAWKVYSVDTMDTASLFPKSIAENAAEVDAFIDQLRSSQNIWSVDLVGHSMGGLISRQYIQDSMSTYQITGTTRGDVPTVRRLVMLGTPNGGSPCALMAPLPATVELRPDVVAFFNNRVTDRRGVDFSVAAGYHLPFTCASPLPGDDVVPLVSAGLGMDDVVQFDDMPHTSMTGSHELFNQFVLPRLSGTSIGLAASSSSGFGTEDAAVAESDGQALFVDTLSMEPGTNTAVGVTVPVEATTVGATLAAHGTVRAELVDPTGVVRATIANISGEYPSFRSMSAPAIPGRWIVRVVNSGDAYEEVAIGAFAGGVPVVLEAAATQVHWSGRVQLTATLERPAADRPAALVGEVRDATGAERPVVLTDDGLSGDGLAGDGRYGATVRDLPAGPALLTLNVIDLGFMRATTAGVVVAIPDVPPPNTAPTADALSIEVGRDTPQQITLTGTDAENDDLVVTHVSSPAHGTISGIAPNVWYTPAAGYVGPDSFTFVVSDGQVSSTPGTVTIDVGAAPVEILYDGPFPASGGQGEQVALRARVVDPTYAGVGGVSVTFAMGGQEWVATTSVTGYTGVVVVIDLDPGEYELHITTEASGEYRAGAGMQPFTVTATASPTVKLGSIQSTEAG
ncbi:MAG TPA: alpha/beta fold hydrolase, partial [Ilumatobacter sp.]|nr:alpha/beta fold hydrolase [Ilumatobacter sp.]